ncbi:MAG: DUF1080 domain-containing protein [Bacteroidota bacterium]|jgi:hypothetical protein|nr:DUF1080 domain-containing protein [Bacteroidota bacterium]
MLYKKILITLSIISVLYISFSFTPLPNKRPTTWPDDWIRLFDGKTFNGWHSYGKTTVGKAWTIENGTIHLNAADKKSYQTEGGGDLITNQSYRNFNFKVDWKIARGGNSGILFLVQDNPAKFHETWNTGLEMQVLDNDGHPDGKIHKHRAGDLYDLIACSKETVKPVGEWNTAEIIVNHNQLQLILNETVVVKTTLWDTNWQNMIANSKFKNMPGFGMFKEGHIALQDHGNDVWFKNIQIRPLP